MANQMAGSNGIPVGIDGQEPEPEFTSQEVIVHSDPISAMALTLYLEENPGIPLHEQYLLQQSEEVQESVADLIYGEEAIALSSLVGRTLKVTGMFIHEALPYMGKDGLAHEGYYQTRLIFEDDTKKGEPLTVAYTSSKTVFLHALHILKRRGWYVFDEPQMYRVVIGRNNSQHILNTRHDKTASAKK